MDTLLWRSWAFNWFYWPAPFQIPVYHSIIKTSGGWTRWSTEVPSNPEHSVILWLASTSQGKTGPFTSESSHKFGVRDGKSCLKFEVTTEASRALISPNPSPNAVSSIITSSTKKETFTMLNLNVFSTYGIAHFHTPTSETTLIHNTFSFVPFLPSYFWWNPPHFWAENVLQKETPPTSENPYEKLDDTFDILK